MMTNFRLIRYIPKYRNAVLKLHAEAIAELPSGLELPKNEHADLLNIEAHYLQTGGEFLVGLLDGEPVAMGGYERVDDATAKLKRFRVQKDLRGRGLGSLLLNEVERIAAENGVTKVVLETVKFRPLTLRYYRKHGYTQCGEQHYGTVETMYFEKVFGSNMTQDTIYHLVVESEFQVKGDKYIPTRFDLDGFIHRTGDPDTVLAVANDYFSNVEEPVMVLVIETAQVIAEVRFEPPAPIEGSGTSHLEQTQLFPHIYGPLNVDAVKEIRVLQKIDGLYHWPDKESQYAEHNHDR
jgi:uncharacterized protein (DUF952 family)/GNAT superfamily N-acetyltransferase